METQIQHELEVVTPKMMEVSEGYKEIFMLGKVLHASGYFRDLRDQAQAIAKILFGKELNFSPIVSLMGIHIIEGKPALSSNLMATLIKRSGKYDYRVKSWSNTECVLSFVQKTGQQGKVSSWEEVGESSFTIEDARTAGIPFKSANGHPTSWTKYPKAMLFARALSQGLRTYCPDVSASPIYNPEEMGAVVNEEGEVTELPKSARPVEVTTEEIKIEPVKTAQQGARMPVKVQHEADSVVPSLLSANETPARARNGGEHTAPGASVKGLVGDVPAAAEPLAAGHAVNGVYTTTLPPLPENEYISADDARAIYNHVKKFLPKDKQKESIVRGLIHDWAKMHGLVDVKGDGTLLKVKKVYMVDGKEVDGVTRTRTALEHHFLDLLAESTESK